MTVPRRAGFAACLLAMLACGPSAGRRAADAPPPEPGASVEPRPPVPPEWESNRAVFIRNCVDGAGPTVDTRVSTEACGCVFEDVSRRYSPARFAMDYARIGRELQARGVLDDCRRSAQARFPPPR
jgi:hypothetical protein